MTESKTESPTTLRIERTFNAPAQTVFDAWTNPEVMRRFWAAQPDWDTPVAESDLRVGGRLRVVMRTPERPEYGGSGEYTEVQPPERLAFTWTWDDSVDRTSLLELAFNERDGATTVVLTHSGLADEESVKAHTDGWNGVLDNLELALEGRR